MLLGRRTLVVIPAYNEEKYIGDVLRDVLRYVDRRDVLVVDDASSDRTYEIASSFGVNVLRHEVNRGLGGALRSGFNYAIENGYDYVITFDGDGQHRGEWIPIIKEKVFSSGCDFCYGVRFGRFPFIKRVGNFLIDLMMVPFTGRLLRDTQSGFRMIRVDLLRRMRFTSERYGISSELLYRAVKLGARICTVPIEAIYLDVKKGTNVRWGLHIAYEFLKVVSGK